MNRVFSFLAALIIFFLIYSFYLSTFEFQLFEMPSTVKVNSVNQFYDYRVSANIHSKFSLGSGTYESIAQEAAKTKQNFVIFTDINMPQKIQSDRYDNRIGLIFAEKMITDDLRTIQYSSENGTNQLRYAAHPLKSNYDIQVLEKSDFSGMEVFNLKNITQSAWKKSKFSTIWSLIFYPFNPRLSLIRLYIEPTDELNIFDQISQRKKFVMYMGSEASARAIPITNLIMKFPSYERNFSVGSQHLLLNSELTGDIKKDRISVIEALRNGQFYISFDELGEPTGFESYLIAKDGSRTLMGGTIHFKKDLKLFYKLPSEPNVFFEVVVFKNGVRYDHLNTSSGSFLLNGPGTYRLQVRLSPRLPLPDAVKWLSWIYTNNFYVEP